MTVSQKVKAEMAALEEVHAAAVRLADFYEEWMMHATGERGPREVELRTKILPNALAFYKQAKRQLLAER